MSFLTNFLVRGDSGKISTDSRTIEIGLETERRFDGDTKFIFDAASFYSSKTHGSSTRSSYNALKIRSIECQRMEGLESLNETDFSCSNACIFSLNRGMTTLSKLKMEAGIQTSIVSGTAPVIRLMSIRRFFSVSCWRYWSRVGIVKCGD